MQPNGPYSPHAYAPAPPIGPPGAPGYGAAQPLYRQNVFVPPGSSTAPLLGPGLRTSKLLLGIGQAVTLLAGTGLLVAGIALGPDDGGLLTSIGAGLLGLWYLMLFAYGIVGLVWTYKFWSWIPPEQRHTNLWKRYISPGTALGFMFIPYFNIFWMIVITMGIADILERMRVAYPTSKGPAKTLALIRIIASFVFFPAAPFLDYMFDKHVEGMASDMQAHMNAQGGLGALGPR